MNTKISQMQEQADNLFLELGFIKSFIKEIPTYEYKGKFYKLTFVVGLNSFVIEYANDAEDAKKNLFEDADLIPADLSISEFISKMEEILQAFYLE